VDDHSEFDETQLRQRFDRLRARLADRVWHSRALDVVRDAPLASAALAFSAGFLVAVLTASGDRHWAVDRARRQLRALLLSGVTALLANELREILGEAGLGDLMESLLDGDEV
jgi:hypothetical protein